MKYSLFSIFAILLLLPLLCAQGAETELRVAPASEGRTVMEEGLQALGLYIAPYELSHEVWGHQGLSRYEIHSPSNPFAMHQIVDGKGQLMDSAAFFLPHRATEQEIAWAQEHLRDVWVLTLRTIYPDLSDAQAMELIDTMEDNLAPDEAAWTDSQGVPGLRGNAGLGDYAFSLVMQEKGDLGSYLQISYIGGPWGYADPDTDNERDEAASTPEPLQVNLYYNAKGGKFFHAAAEGCPGVDPSYFPLARFPSEALSTSPYSLLRPCPRCMFQR